MSKISREDNKKRYKTGMYPTQQDFENVFDSYVHKDDTIDPSKIVSGDENIVDIINRKAEEKHSHEIKDVDGLQTFIDEMTSLLEIVRDPETGEISQSKLKTLTEGIAALRDDIDTNTDNIAGHEIRITNNTAALEKVYAILGKDAKESIDDLANRFAALSGNYANVYAFINKVKQFLEDADASDETINRWQEIESFLQGITDTETLAGLLEQQRTYLEGRIAEAIAAIPKGNYLKLVPDLDAYTDAPDGEIVKYTGETNDKYTHGWDYEWKAENIMSVSVPLGSKYISILKVPDEYSNLQGVNFYPTGRSIEAIRFKATLGTYYYLQDTEPKVGDVVVCFSDSDDPGTTITITEINDGVPTLSNGYTVVNSCASTWYEYVSTDGEYILVLCAPDTDLTDFQTKIYLSSSPCELVKAIFTLSAVDSDGFSFSFVSTPSSWQLCPSMPVIQ